MTQTAIAAPDRPRRSSRRQRLALEYGRAIRHGDGGRPWVKDMARELAEAELLAAVDRYRARTGSPSTIFARAVHRRLTTGVR